MRCREDSGGLLLPWKPVPPKRYTSVLQRVAQCTLEHYGLGDIAVRGVSWLGAVPVDKAACDLSIFEGASKSTNAISYLGIKMAPGLKLCTQILGTNRVFGLLGRANIALAAGFLAYDVTSIALCTAEY